MKLKVLQPDFSKSLAIASRFASPKAQLPVLGNVLLLAKKNKLLLGATNLETSIFLKIGAQVEEVGDITIPAKVLADIVSNLPKEHIELISQKEKLKIVSPGNSLDVAGIISSDFPDIPQSIDDDTTALDTNLLIEALPQVLFSTSHDETRPVLTGVLVTINNEELSLVATDGFRLSRKIISGSFKSKDVTMILPKSVLAELTRLVAENETVSFSLSEKESSCIFAIGDTILSSRILQGEFPNFSKIIPNSSRCTILVDKEEFSRSVKLASVFARDSANVVTFTIKNNELRIQSQSDKVGEQSGKIEAKVEGFSDKDELEIGFNYRFVEEFINSVKGESIQLKFIDSDTAGVFLDPGDKEYLHLIMPVKL